MLSSCKSSGFKYFIPCVNQISKNRRSNQITQVLAHFHSFFFKIVFSPITLKIFNTNLIGSLQKRGCHSQDNARRRKRRWKYWFNSSYFHWKSLGCQFYNRFKKLCKIDSKKSAIAKNGSLPTWMNKKNEVRGTECATAVWVAHIHKKLDRNPINVT